MKNNMSKSSSSTTNVPRGTIFTAKGRPASQGYLLHEAVTPSGDAFAVIATGFKTPTDNRKTGNMIQIWIILKDVSPVEGVKTGIDARSICQDCPFASGNGCYVNVGQAPLGIWKSYHKGNYPAVSADSFTKLFAGRKVRFGAYGNPTLIPLPMVKKIAKASEGWTGYFHNWHSMNKLKAKAYNQFFMASTETADSYAIAEKLSLRVFHVSPIQPTNTVECLSDSHGIACADCQLCQGWAKRAKSVWINPHGSTVKKAVAASMA